MYNVCGVYESQLTLGRRKMLDLQCIICCCKVKKKLRI